ncbi:MAG: DUF1573 domain-containing protein [Bacillota bacterium]|uniref:hypothetical protein n=1 Tax=Desulfurispora thermophila TaxID=265470 RepID=UPI0003651BB3|nr:hypothetical protein [Desulfurispora thermophila]
MLKDIICDEFQITVSELLVVSRSILDLLGRLQEISARLTRYLTRAATSCGCIKITACKQDLPAEVPYSELKSLLDTHISGQLCENCRENIETCLGQMLFYLAAICNHLDLNLYDILLKEYKQMKLLGHYKLA